MPSLGVRSPWLQASKQLTLTQRPPHPLVCSCAYVWQLLLDMCKSLPPPACLFFAIECLLYAQRDSPWLTATVP